MSFGLTPQQVQFLADKKNQDKIAKEGRRLDRQNKDKQRWSEGKSLAKGLGKITSDINNFIHKIREKVNDVYYGKTSTNSQSKKINPLDYGLINILNLLLEVDICSILDYALNKIPSAPVFDPKDKENQSKTVLGKIKWEAQNAAYQIQKSIDDFYNFYGDPKSPDNRIRLFALTQDLTNKLQVSRDLFRDEALLEAFPSLSVMNNFFESAQGYYDRYTDPNSINHGDIKNILDFVDKTRSTCLAVQALNDTKSLLQFTDTYFGTSLMDEIQKLNKYLDPKKLNRVLKQINDVSKKVQSMTNNILQYVNYGRMIISLCLTIVIIMRILNKFFTLLAIPNIFTILGLSTKMSEANGKVVDTADYFTNRLNEINSVLSNVYNLCQDLSLKIQNILYALKQLVENLLACNQPDTTIIAELNTTIQNFEKIQTQLLEFINNYEEKKKKQNNTFGNYTISILSEELTDDFIPRKRRYGVALDSGGSVVVQSTPTFASDDMIIIEEVKLLLVSKNLVEFAATTPDQMRIMEEAMNYLPDMDITLDSLNVGFDSGYDEPDNEDEEVDDSLNLNAFVSKLKGGRKLRRRMRKQMAKQKLDLANSLANVSKGKSLTGGMVKKQRLSAINDAILAQKEQIKILNEEISKLKILAFTTAIPNPAILLLIKRKQDQIKDCEKQIQNLNNQLSSIK